MTGVYPKLKVNIHFINIGAPHLEKNAMVPRVRKPMKSIKKSYANAIEEAKTTQILTKDSFG